MKFFNLEKINEDYIHKLTDEEISRSLNTNGVYVVADATLPCETHGTVYRSSHADPKTEESYRRNVLDLLEKANEIFESNHNNKSFLYNFKTNTISVDINIAFDYNSIPHIFGFDDEKIFSTSIAGEEKMNILTKGLTEDFNTIKTSKGKIEFFIKNRNTIIMNEISEYKNLLVSAFNYGKLYTKLSTYVNYANLDSVGAYIVSEESKPEGKGKGKGKDKDKDKEQPKYTYSLLTPTFDKSEKFNVCKLILIKDGAVYKPYSLIRTKDKHTITLTKKNPAATSPAEDNTKQKEVNDMTEKNYINNSISIPESSNILYRDAGLFLRNNKKNTFVMIDHNELLDIITKVELVEILYNKSSKQIRNALKSTYDEAVSILKAIDLKESICVDKADISRINSIIQRKLFVDYIDKFTIPYAKQYSSSNKTIFKVNSINGILYCQAVNRDKYRKKQAISIGFINSITEEDGEFNKLSELAKRFNQVISRINKPRITIASENPYFNNEETDCCKRYIKK